MKLKNTNISSASKVYDKNEICLLENRHQEMYSTMHMKGLKWEIFSLPPRKFPAAKFMASLVNVFAPSRKSY